MTPEKKVQNDIINYLTMLINQGHPLFFERRQAGGLSYKKGIPDLYAVYDGKHIEIEVKAPDGELSSMQIKFKQKCKRLNILWICADSLDLFIEFLVKNFPNHKFNYF